MEERKEEKKKKSLNLKNKIYHLFRSSVKSSTCNLSSKNLPISVQNPVFVSSSFHHQSNDTTSSSSLFNLHRSLSLPSFSDHMQQQQQPRFFSFTDELQKKKNSGDDKNKTRNTKKKKKKKLCSNPYGFTTTSSESDGGDIDDDDGFFSSDELEEEGHQTLFSSRSFSSDSSGFYYNSSRSRKKKGSRRRRNPQRGGESIRGSGKKHTSDDGFRPLVSISSRNTKNKSMKEAVAEEKKFGEGDNGVAVVRESEDPYADFRISMLEMIVENQIFGKKDLDELLQSYLFLNSPSHHSIILSVFSDICDVLFCN